MTPRDTKSVPSSSNVRTTVRNIVSKIPRFIALSMVKIRVTPLWSVTSLIKGLKINTIPNMEKSITRRISKEPNLLQAEAAYQRAKYKKLKKLLPRIILPKRRLSF